MERLHLVLWHAKNIELTKCDLKFLIKRWNDPFGNTYWRTIRETLDQCLFTLSVLPHNFRQILLWSIYYIYESITERASRISHLLSVQCAFSTITRLPLSQTENQLQLVEIHLSYTNCSWNSFLLEWSNAFVHNQGNCQRKETHMRLQRCLSLNVISLESILEYPGYTETVGQNSSAVSSHQHGKSWIKEIRCNGLWDFIRNSYGKFLHNQTYFVYCEIVCFQFDRFRIMSIAGSGVDQSFQKKVSVEGQPPACDRRKVVPFDLFYVTYPPCEHLDRKYILLLV